MSSGVRVYYREDTGWLVETPIGLTPAQVAAVVAHARKTFAAQAMAYGPGDRRDAITRNMATLTAANIRQKLIGTYPWEQDRVLV